MFNVNELELIRDILKNMELQDETALSLIDKIDEIVKSANECKECLWSFYWYFGRQGEVEGLFKATREEVEDAIGREVYFGEILGKHSEVYGILEKDDIKLISDNPIEVMNAAESGYNPLKYLSYECEKCGISYCADEFDIEKSLCCCCANEME